MNRLKLWLRNKFVLGGVVIVLLGGGFWFYRHLYSAPKALQYVTAAVQKGTLTVSVDATGSVAAANQVDVKPGAAGKILSLSAATGQAVKAGQTLATLDGASAYNKVRQAQVSLEQAQENYDTVAAGASDDDVEAKQKALASAKDNYEETVREQQADVDKARTNYMNSGLELHSEDSLTKASVALSGEYTGTEEGSYQINISYGSEGPSYSAHGLGSGGDLIERGVAQPIGNGLYITFGSTGEINANSVWTIDVPNKTSNQYNANVLAYNDALYNQPRAVQAAQQAVDDAQEALNEILEPAKDSDVQAAEIQLETARINLSDAQIAYAGTRVTAPFDGIVASVGAQVGDDATASTVIATLITKQKVAQVSLNEVDVTKVKVGQQANLTFDAVDGLTITGRVAEVDQIGTTSQGVVAYPVQILLDTDDDRIKPNMSVTATIITDVHQDVLLVPSSAVKTAGDNAYVQTLTNGQPTDITVQVGASNDTDTEITDGLQEGQEIVTQTIDPNAKTTTAATGTGAGRAAPAAGGGNAFRGGAGFGGGGAVRVGF